MRFDLKYPLLLSGRGNYKGLIYGIEYIHVRNTTTQGYNNNNNNDNNNNNYYYYYYTICMSPVTGISPRHFSWTSGDPHHSRFKLHTAVLSVLCVMFQVQLSFVVNLSSVFLVQFPNFFLNFSLLFQWLQLLLVQPYISRSTIRCISIHKLLYFNFFSASFCTTFPSAGIATSISVHVYYYYSYTICMSPVTGISSWYFSWTSGDPHCSGFKLHIAVLSVLCVMFQV